MFRDKDATTVQKAGLSFPRFEAPACNDCDRTVRALILKGDIELAIKTHAESGYDMSNYNPPERLAHEIVFMATKDQYLEGGWVCEVNSFPVKPLHYFSEVLSQVQLINSIPALDCLNGRSQVFIEASIKRLKSIIEDEYDIQKF